MRSVHGGCFGRPTCWCFSQRRPSIFLTFYQLTEYIAYCIPRIHRTRNFARSSSCTMATDALEARFEQIALNDQNEDPHHPSSYHKSKVCRACTLKALLTGSGFIIYGHIHNRARQCNEDAAPETPKRKRRQQECRYHNHQSHVAIAGRSKGSNHHNRRSRPDIG